MIENVIIIGSGPAGLSAAIYTAREDFKPLMITGSIAGGQLLLTTTVENYPGFPNGVQGPELIDGMTKQAQKFGARMIAEDVTEVDFSKRPFTVKTAENTYQAHTIIISTGANARTLGIPSEMEHMGKGVSTCATCLPPNSLIVSNPSTKKIGQTAKGMRVLTVDGTFRPVAEVMKRKYKGELIGFKTRLFRSEYTFLTPNHPVLVKTLKRGKGVNYHKVSWSKPFWVEAGELNKRHVVLYPIVKKTATLFKFDISKELKLRLDNKGRVMQLHETHTSHRLPNTINVDKDFGRLVGYYLSEGYSHSRGMSFAFNIKETEYARDVKRIIKRKFGLDAAIKPEKSVLKVTVYSMILSKLFQKWFSKYSHEKRMPHLFVTMERSLQKELIKGMWRGDGCTRAEDFVITTSSRELAEQLKMILLRLNILPHLEKRRFKTLEHSTIEGREVRFKRDVYQLVIGGPWIKMMSKVLDERHPLLAKKKHRWNYHAWIIDNYVHLPIKTIIKKSYDGLVYNLAVEGNHTYVTTNSIVHNCDGAFFKGKDNVVVVGGGDTAMEDSNFLTRFVKQVTIVHRKDSFRASKIMQQIVLSNPKIKVVWNSTVEEILGKDVTGVEGVRIKDVNTGKESTIPCQGVFIAIGYVPNTQFLEGKLSLDDQGYIVTKEEVLTEIPGVFVAGDVSDRFYRQAGTAAASGIKAALRVREFMQNMQQ